VKHLTLILICFALVAGCAPEGQSPDESHDLAPIDAAEIGEADLDGAVALIGIDADHDGTLTYEDFAAALAKEALFAEYDRDGDGVLSQTEFAVFSASGLDPYGSFQRYDADRSGYISPEEFSRGLFDSLFGHPSYPTDDLQFGDADEEESDAETTSVEDE
jgi:Ca2+-binding EF-hand superfamily protein